MTVFAEWLERVLTHGEAVFDGPPAPGRSDLDMALGRLERAFAINALDVAGPPLPFDATAAMAAARFLAGACWRVVAPDDGGIKLQSPGEPATPAAHLSADVMLRFLPAVLGRARLRDEALAKDITEVLCRWPLSGVLAALAEPPTTSLAFGGHSGLQLLYAERLARHARPAWVPIGGAARERAELVFAQRGLPAPRPTREGVKGD